MKKSLLLFTLVFCFAIGTRAQSVASGTDPALTFQRFSKCELEWVALSNRDAAGRYIYGYIYVDEKQGFMFRAEGLFRVDQNHHYFIDTLAFPTEHPKIQIPSNWQDVAIISSQHYTELGVQLQPDWVAPYYAYTDTVEYNEHCGIIFNEANEPAVALQCLQKVWQLNDHTSKVAYQLGWACNAVGKYDEAITVLAPAVKFDGGNALLSKQLADAYSHKNDGKKAIVFYKQAIAHMPEPQSEAKSETAFELANVYKKMGNTAEYTNWMTQARSFTPADSLYSQAIKNAGF